MRSIRFKIIKQFLLTIGILLSLVSCGGNVAYQIEGKLTNLEDQTVYAVFENEDIKVVDTITWEKPGKFLIQQKQGDFREVTLFFEGKTRWVTAFLEGEGKITISGDINYPTLLKVKGGRINDRLSSMKKELAPLLKERADLARKLHGDKQNRDSVNIAIEDTDIASRLANIHYLLEEKVTDLVKKNSKEEASVVLIRTYFMRPDDTRQMDEL